MTRKRVRLGMALAFGIMLTGCSSGNSDPTYTVWTDLITYSEFSSKGRTLEDGMYTRVELSNSQFSQMSSSLTNEYKHVWTENQLYDWFIGREFGSAEASKEKAWLITINHGIIFSRSRSIVYILMK